MKAAPMLRLVFRALSVLGLCAAALVAQRADRATITGVVQDPNGAYIADASVKIRNEGTGVENVFKTNGAGAYNSPLLTLGLYSVTVEHPGFKTHVRTGIQLTGGAVVRQDAVMELGAVSERVEVSAAAEMVNTSQPEVQHTVDSNYYKNLPVVMGADIRLAEALLQLQPGYLPMKPNGDPMFRGSQFSSRMNGGQTFGAENFFDGAAFGYASGHQQSHESAPSIEAVAEMKVTNTTYSAQYGHTTGGTIEYTSKSGTNEFHGNLYEYLANDKLNARGFFPARASKARNNAYGFTVGGPVFIPGLYDGKNKTHFFFNMDWLKLRSGVLPGFGNTTPIDAFKQGDFSALLGNQVGTDVRGRPILSGQIFDPNTTSTVNGVTVRDPFAGNIIPASHPLRSSVAAKIVPLMVRPDRPGTHLNVAGNPAGDQTWVANFRTPLIRIDHQFNPRFKTAHTFFWPHRPALRNCGEVDGCNANSISSAETAKNDDYFGIGFHQRISTQHAGQQFDTIITNNLLHHAAISFDRWFMGGIPLSAGVGWADKLWGPGRSGLVDTNAGPPNITFTTGNVPYTQLGMNWIGFGFEAINRWQFSNDLTWIKGKHTIKVGYEFRHHQFNYHGWAKNTGGTFNFNRLGTSGYDAAGNSLATTGDPFASFLLGQVHQANFTIPNFVTFNGNWTSLFINDDIKVTNRLTMTFGLRFDYQFPWTERHNRMSTFDTATPNPGAGGRPGALIFAGTGQGRTGSRTFDQINADAIGPRFGFAYRLGDKTVVRGGYGLYYNSVAFGQGGQPIIGFEANPTAANLTNGIQPAFSLDQGFPQSAIRFPPFIDPTFANGTAPVAYPRDGLTLPRYQNWSFTIQRQLSENTLFDISYVGNRGTRLPHNPQSLGIPYNMNHPDVLRLGTAVLQSNINSPQAQAAGIALPYAGFTGNVAQALRAYPQYQAIEYRDVPIGKSIYHSMQWKVDRRFSNGMQFRVFHTWSKLINNGAESAQRGGAGFVQNPIDTQKAEYVLSVDDVPHAFVVAYTYQLPFGKNMSGVMAKLLRGWTFNGILRYESGRPLNVFMVNDLAGLLFNSQKRPNRTAGADAIADIEKFDPNVNRYFNTTAWTDPGPLQFGNAARRDTTVRGFRNYTEDISLFKETNITERIKHRFEAQAGNITNRTVFCDPNQNWSGGAAFGQVGTQCNTPRSIQFGMKVEF